MNRFFFLILILFFNKCLCQELPAQVEQQVEAIADAGEEETGDDSFLRELEHFRKEPIDINAADVEELKQLFFLTALQIECLLNYRHLLGRLTSIYELQAVPSWDLGTIRKVLPFIKLGPAVPLAFDIHQRFKRGQHSFLFRVSRPIGRSVIDDNNSGGYQGGPEHLLFRYQYRFKNLLQFGITSDKDAGESFLKGGQIKAFDFYSFHFFLRNAGIIKTLALGDFTVNIGQGLVHWQGLAFKKSADVMAIKRQAPVLKAYSSAGEFYFHRGAGLTIGFKKIEATIFASIRRIDVNITADSVSGGMSFSSFITGGYHRNLSEIESKNNLGQTCAGAVIQYKGDRLKIGVNGVYYQFSLPLQKRDEPYNLYAMKGDEWLNASIDYSYTFKNLHFFGESAISKRAGKAFINGLLLSADTKVDLSLLFRHIEKSYQAVNGNAFTENTSPSNESGIYTGITIRPRHGWKLDAYADIFQFPWLRFGADAPGRGVEYFCQLTYTPNRKISIQARYRREIKPANEPGSGAVMNEPMIFRKTNFRAQLNCQVHPAWTYRTRAEVVDYGQLGQKAEQGFLSFIDVIYKPVRKPYGVVARWQYFETGGYDSRIYVYENDVQYSYSAPAFFDKGFRFYVILNCDIGKKISAWLRVSQTKFHEEKQSIEISERITSSKKVDMNLQLRVVL